MSLLRMWDVDKAFAGVPALRAASLEVGAGEVHAVPASIATPTCVR